MCAVLAFIAASNLLAGIDLSVAADASEGAEKIQASWSAGEAEWDTLEISANQRAITIGFRSDSCGERGAHVTVKETARSVKLAVPRETAIFAPGSGAISCPAPKMRTLIAGLAHPLGGREILGRTAKVLHDPQSIVGLVSVGRGGERSSVPRVIGFSPADAAQTLSIYSLHGRMHAVVRPGSGLRRVVGQVPRPGTELPPKSVVQLRVAR